MTSSMMVSTIPTPSPYFRLPYFSKTIAYWGNVSNYDGSENLHGDVGGNVSLRKNDSLRWMIERKQQQCEYVTTLTPSHIHSHIALSKGIEHLRSSWRTAAVENNPYSPGGLIASNANKRFWRCPKMLILSSCLFVIGTLGIFENMRLNLTPAESTPDIWRALILSNVAQATVMLSAVTGFAWTMLIILRFVYLYFFEQR
jgi:hypothetical protein